jgi:hypothetical protein
LAAGRFAAGAIHAKSRLVSAGPSRQNPGMNRLCIFVGVTLGGILGGVLGNTLGLGFFSLGGFLMSGLGSLVGVWAGWKAAQKLG